MSWKPQESTPAPNSLSAETLALVQFLAAT